MRSLAQYKMHLNPALDRHLAGDRFATKVAAANAFWASAGVPAELGARG